MADTIKNYEPTWRENSSSSLQSMLMDRFGMSAYNAMKMAQKVTGGGQGLVGGMGLLDFTPVGLAFAAQEGGTAAGQGAAMVEQGNVLSGLLNMAAGGLALTGSAGSAANKAGKLAKAADRAENALRKTKEFAKLKGTERENAIAGVRANAQGVAIERSKSALADAVGGEGDIARSLMQNPGFKVAGAVAPEKVDAALAVRNRLRSEPATTPGPNASEKDWADWGATHGVNMTRTPDVPVGISDLTTGKAITIPGGLDGTFTIPDMFAMKGNNFNPHALPEDLHTELMKKFIRTHDIKDPDAVDMFNRLNFALLSPNAPLTQNEFLAQRARLVNMDELQALAGRVGEPGLNKTAAEQLGVGAAGSGGMGVLGTAALGNQAMLAKLILDKPDMFKIGQGETMRDVTARVMNQVPGLGPKTASLGTPWLDLNKANTSAVDLHMINNAYERLLSDPKVGPQFTERMAGLLGTEATPTAVMASPGRKDRAIEVVGGTDNSRVYRTKDGALNNIPAAVTPDRLAYEPKQFQDFNPFYQRVVDYVDESRGATPSIELFPEQWRLWDTYRKRVEPHEFAHPDFRKLPRQSWSEMQAALQAHKDAGYTQAINPVMKDTDWRKLYYGKADLGLLGALGAAGAGAAGVNYLVRDE